MNNYKVLGQCLPSANNLYDVYIAPSRAVCSTLVVCNQGLTATIRVAVRPSGVPIEGKHYIVFDTVLNSNDTMFLTVGLTVSATDVVSVQANTDTVSFSLFGTEIS